jgi:hypothetical protein
VSIKRYCRLKEWEHPWISEINYTFSITKRLNWHPLYLPIARCSRVYTASTSNYVKMSQCFTSFLLRAASRLGLFTAGAETSKRSKSFLVTFCQYVPSRMRGYAGEQGERPVLCGWALCELPFFVGVRNCMLDKQRRRVQSCESVGIPCERTYSIYQSTPSRAPWDLL